MTNRTRGSRARFASRLLGSLCSLLLLSFVCFALIEWAPGDSFSHTAMNPQLTKGSSETLRARYSLDRPLVWRFGSWLAGLSQGKLGPSYSYQVDASELLLPRLGATLVLNLASMGMAFAIAAPLALFAASRPSSATAVAFRHAMQGMLAIPEILIVLGLVVLALQREWPLPGGAESAGAARSIAKLLVPATALSIGALPVFFGHLRAAWEEARRAPFVGTARHHGIAAGTLRWRYVLPAAANPLISLLGLTFGALFSASLIVETVTGWPGMGPLLLEAVFARDTHVVVGAALLAGGALTAGNLLADLALQWLDPRIRQ